MNIKNKIVIIVILGAIVSISSLFIMGAMVGDGDIDNLDKETCTKIKHTFWDDEKNKCSMLNDIPETQEQVTENSEMSP